MTKLRASLLQQLALVLAVITLGVSVFSNETQAADKEKPVERDYSRVIAPPAPANQSVA